MTMFPSPPRHRKTFNKHGKRPKFQSSHANKTLEDLHKFIQQQIKAIK